MDISATSEKTIATTSKEISESMPPLLSDLNNEKSKIENDDGDEMEFASTSVSVTPLHSAIGSLHSKSDDEFFDDTTEMVLRKRHGWSPDIDSLIPNDLDLLGDDVEDELVEEDEAGCPLPSTPEDHGLIEAEVFKVYENQICNLI